MPERTLAIRVDEELYRRVKVRVAQKQQSLKDYLIELIQEDLDSETDESDSENGFVLSVSMKELEEFFKSHELKWVEKMKTP